MQGRIQLWGIVAGIVLVFAGAWANDLDTCGSFRDTELSSLLQSNASGIIYSWSPHMPLSVRGLYEAQKIAQDLRVLFIPVYDPYADSIPEYHQYSCHPIHSTTLKRLGILNHYPSVLVFSNGKISSPLLPGYEEPESLKTFIGEHL